MDLIVIRWSNNNNNDIILLRVTYEVILSEQGLQMRESIGYGE